MKAQETTLKELLEGTKQYQVPLYQRTYSWVKEQHERLWSDLVLLAEDRRVNREATHFLGSVVLAPSPSNGPTGVHRYLVVDGQQRLTTLSILLAALRDHRAATEGPQHRDRINEQYLENKWESEDARLKLSPTQADRESYRACIRQTAGAGSADGIGEAYRYFTGRLSASANEDTPVDVQALEEAVLLGLALVSVTAQKDDNVHRIFESLNNTGLQLTQGDLLRNYLFMRLDSKAEEAYTDLWLPLQRTLAPKQLELLFWLDLVQDDPKARQSTIYSDQVQRLEKLRDEHELVEEIARFQRLGDLLAVILNPDREHDADVRTRLTRLKAWGTSTVYPLLLHLMDRRDRGTATSDQIAAAMLSVESFLVRRLLIGRATANINRTLLATTSEVKDEEDVAAAVHRYLSTGRKYFASDKEVAASLTTVPFYLNGRSNQRKLVLQWIEESYASKEPVDPSQLTIEHIMPRTATDAWREELAPELGEEESFEEVHQGLQHTLGNLTLTGYNSTLSNSPFATKRTHLATSGLRMNQEIAAVETWGREAIRARARSLAARIAAIWPEPEPSAQAEEVPPSWQKLARAIAEIPPGAWTTYGDLAALIGNHPVPVGARIAKHPMTNGHRVLQAEGTISPGFRWYEPDRTEDPQSVLEEEGVRFDAAGRADRSQRLSADDLADLLGVTSEDTPGIVSVPAGQDETLRASFLEQLGGNAAPAEVDAVLHVIRAWENLGGEVSYGTAATTSCFLLSRAPAKGSIWPVAIYPDGSIEVVFQHLATRPPFDDLQLRDELRSRLNRIAGVDIPTSKLTLRPSVKFSSISSPSGLETFVSTLEWFFHEVDEHWSAPADEGAPTFDLVDVGSEE